MPKIYEYFGLIFFFYSKDHIPIHVHVSYGEYESKLELVYKNGILTGILIKKVKGKKPLPPKLLADAEKFAKVKEKGITKKWLEFFGKNQNSPKFERITKKV